MVENGVFDITVKDNWFFTLMILQPEIITKEIFEEGLAEVRRKRGISPSLSRIKLKYIKEGLCIQTLHIGAYSTEPVTVQRMSAFASENRYHDQVSSGGKHHEIYLGDLRRADSEKLKTILRHPIEKRS